MNQERMPFVEALEAYRKKQYIPFHTPGHKIGVGAPHTLSQWMEKALPYDLGVMYALDDLHEPEGALLEAEQLASQLYGATCTWYSINGTTSLIETMILATVGEGDTLLIPRDAHRSVHSGLVLSGAYPAYMETTVDEYYGIPLGITESSLCTAIAKHPEAKAVLFVYPNYFGVASNLKRLIDIAHEAGLIVLVDEAHGAHLPFHKELPPSALSCDADLVAQSTHKLIGSLTQTSMLHAKGDRFSKRRITEAFQMLQSTSPNYIFLASLDMARQQMAIEGESILKKSLQLAKWLRKKLAMIDGIRIFMPPSPWEMDLTKIYIDASLLGLSGRSLELKLRKEGIEVELIHGPGVLLLITIGDTKESAVRLVQAVSSVAASVGIEKISIPPIVVLPEPVVKLTPRDVFYKEKEVCSLTDALGRIVGETITYYPPGIPVISRGEVFTEEVFSYIETMKKLGFIPNGAKDSSLQTIEVVKDR